MNKKAIAYVMLKNFPSYEKFIRNIDEEVRFRACKSHTTTYGYGAGCLSIDDLTTQLMKKIEQKRYIVNARILVLEAFKSMQEQDVEILKAKFWERKTLQEIGNAFGFYPLQARRKLLKAFVSYFSKLALSDEFLQICEDEFNFCKPLLIDYATVLQNQNVCKLWFS